jgi:Putative silver efflux pump
MHKFIDRIIAFSLKNKFFIFFCTTIAVIAGIVSFKNTPIDAFPDVSNTKVTIITQWPGRSAEEVEKFITIPIEISMNSVQKKTDIRSTTLFGLSVINVMFDDHVDDSFARQQVYNLLGDADLPDGVKPNVQPISGLQEKFSVIHFGVKTEAPGNLKLFRTGLLNVICVLCPAWQILLALVVR